MDLDRDAQSSSCVHINISGHHFLVEVATFASIPGTRLTDLNPGDAHYDGERDEYFFERNAALFQYIIDGYRHGSIHMPHDVCIPMFMEELQFWGLQDTCIAPCCLTRYLQHVQDQQSLRQLSDHLNDTLHNEYAALSQGNSILQLKYKIWLLLTCPKSSIMAVSWAFIYMLLILFSITIVMMRTHRAFYRDTGRNSCKYGEWSNPRMEELCYSEFLPALRYINYILDFTFLLELVLRVISWPDLRSFVRNIVYVVDGLAVLVMAATTIASIIKPDYWLESRSSAVLVVVGVCCCLRVLRVLKIMQYSSSMRVLQLAVWVSARELLMVLLLLLMATTIFAFLVYYAESISADSHFRDILDASYWAIITMTTVGYGDFRPLTSQGKLIGGFCAFTGILTLSLTVPVVASNFHRFYSIVSLRNTIIEKKGQQMKPTIVSA